MAKGVRKRRGTRVANDSRASVDCGLQPIVGCASTDSVNGGVSQDNTSADGQVSAAGARRTSAVTEAEPSPAAPPLNRRTSALTEDARPPRPKTPKTPTWYEGLTEDEPLDVEQVEAPKVRARASYPDARAVVRAQTRFASCTDSGSPFLHCALSPRGLAGLLRTADAKKVAAARIRQTDPAFCPRSAWVRAPIFCSPQR
eukprot:5513771-Prymnesium_polylepis.1